MTLLYLALAIGMGSLLAVQAGVNGRLRLRAGDPARAALISSAISATTLLIYTLVAVRHPWPPPARLAAAPWWTWTGGLMGAAIVVTTLVLITRLGGALLFALIVVGQMLAALVMDQFGLLGLPRHEINPWRVVGAGLLVAGVVLIRRF